MTHLCFCNIQKGFTLIELVVVVTIMMILGTTGIASFVTFSRSQELNTATQNLVTIMQLAKASATSQVKPVSSLCNSGTLDGYAVTVNPSSSYTAGSNTYSIAPVCGGTADSVTQIEYTLPVNIRFTADEPQTILFHVINGDVTFSPVTQIAYMDVILQNGQIAEIPNPTPPLNGLKVIRVYNDGRINLQ